MHGIAILPYDINGVEKEKVIAKNFLINLLDPNTIPDVTIVCGIVILITILITFILSAFSLANPNTVQMGELLTCALASLGIGSYRERKIIGKKQ